MNLATTLWRNNARSSRIKETKLVRGYLPASSVSSAPLRYVTKKPAHRSMLSQGEIIFYHPVSPV